MRLALPDPAISEMASPFEWRRGILHSATTALAGLASIVFLMFAGLVAAVGAEGLEPHDPAATLMADARIEAPAVYGPSISDGPDVAPWFDYDIPTVRARRADSGVFLGSSGEVFAPRAARMAPCASFVPGTAVLMADGSTKRIEDIELGDHVWAADPETGKEGPREVTRLITGHGDKTLVDIEIDGDTVTATDHHPIWVNNDGEWVDAEDLQPGDYLLDENGVTLLVDDIDIRQVTGQTVHNLTVDDLHTFFVLAGDQAILTHNNNCPVHSSSALRQNMEAVGEFGPGSQAHHVVPGGSYGGNANLASARATLQRFGVGLDDAVNGTYLPPGWHQSVHTGPYFRGLDDALSGAATRADVHGVLRSFANQLQDNLAYSPRTGNLPW